MPVTTWTESDGTIKKYPTLIYHSEVVSSLDVSPDIFSPSAELILSDSTLNAIYFDVCNYNDACYHQKLQDLNDATTYDISITGSLERKLITLVATIKNVLSIQITIDEIALNLNPPSEIAQLIRPFSSVILTDDIILDSDKTQTISEEFVFHPVFFDADSHLYFVQQYGAQKVTTIGDLPPELIGQLNSRGLTPEIINPQDFNGYWNSIDTIIYVENNYELALLASTYASLKNAPLIIAGTDFYPNNIFSKRKVILVGSVNCPSGATCDAQYSDLESLQRKYIQETNTDKIILVNPADLNGDFSDEGLSPEFSSGAVDKLYNNHSLIAPVLAAAKQELIISTPSSISNTCETIDAFLEEKIRSLGIEEQIEFLTIVASYPVIMTSPSTGSPNESDECDRRCYAHLNGCVTVYPYNVYSQGDFYVGRIFGLTSSDASAYIARALWHSQISPREEETEILIGAQEGIGTAVSLSGLVTGLRSLGYNVTSLLPAPVFVSQEMSNKDIIFYTAHGSPTGAGNFGSHDWPWLKNSIVTFSSCDTCNFEGGRENTFCLWAMRKGALGFIAPVGGAFGIHPWYSKFGRILSYDGELRKLILLISNYLFLGDPTIFYTLPYKIPVRPLRAEKVSDDGNLVVYNFSMGGGCFDGLSFYSAPSYYCSTMLWSPPQMPIIETAENFVKSNVEFEKIEGGIKVTNYPAPSCPTGAFGDCVGAFKFLRRAPELNINDGEISYQKVGDTLKFLIPVTNNGEAAAENVAIKLTHIADFCDMVDVAVDRDNDGDCDYDLDIIDPCAYQYALNNNYFGSATVDIPAHHTQNVEISVPFYEYSPRCAGGSCQNCNLIDLNYPGIAEFDAIHIGLSKSFDLTQARLEE